jgi:hypothetical protein
MAGETLEKVQERYAQCKIASEKAADLVGGIPESFDGSDEAKADLLWLCECFEMGRRLTSLLDQYIRFYAELDKYFKKGGKLRDGIKDEIIKLREEIADYQRFIEVTNRKAVDVLGGSMVRRKYMGEFLEDNTSVMLESIAAGIRVTKPLQRKKWW